MNEFFVTVTDSLRINENFDDENATDGITDPVQKAVKKFSNHPSILKIKGHYQNAGPFFFQKVAPDTIEKEVRSLNSKKATSTKILVRRKLSLQIMPHFHSKLGLFMMIAFRYPF